MGKCETSVQQITFDIRDPQVTRVVVNIDYEGDCPMMPRRYEKAFPARIPIIDLFTIDGGIKDHLLWP